MHNLSSSDYSGSTESSPEQHMSPPAAILAAHRIVQIKPVGLSPKTPTRKGQVSATHLLESPADDCTDWVAYSAPIPELDEINLDIGDNSFESFVTESLASRSSTPDTMIERMLDTESGSTSSSTECDDEQVSQSPWSVLTFSPAPQARGGEAPAQEDHDQHPRADALCLAGSHPCTSPDPLLP